jgi:hypothetical protein
MHFRPALPHLGFLTLAALLAGMPSVRAQTDLDAFMQQVLARRDENWKKLQQYVLEERERIEVRGPNEQPLWGERREYAWYVRDGFFVRSPLRFNGVEISEADRRKYEADFLNRERRRERRGSQAAGEAPGSVTDDQNPESLEGLIRQTREPQFISSTYFLRFRFEEGKYALVGRENLDGREVLRVEYYPSKLFSQGRTRVRSGQSEKEKTYAAELQRLMNKASRVTLWVEPSAHQIVKYVFENVDANFLPANWLVRVSDIRASMAMSQPFPNIWLPHDLEVHATMTFAIGDFDLDYALDYHDYRQADIQTTIRSRGGR